MKLFIFDMGSVIVTGLNILGGMAAELGIEKKILKEDYMLYNMPLMDGWMKPSDYYRHLELKFGKKIEGEMFERHFTPFTNHDLLQTVDRLRENGYTCVIGSNTFAPHWDPMLRMKDTPLMHFDRLYASHLIHRSKPEPYFFQYICQMEGVDYKETAFIDDMRENIDTADSLGITTLLYSGENLEERERAFFRPYL